MARAIGTIRFYRTDVNQPVRPGTHRYYCEGLRNEARELYVNAESGQTVYSIGELRTSNLSGEAGPTDFIAFISKRSDKRIREFR